MRNHCSMDVTIASNNDIEIVALEQHGVVCSYILDDYGGDHGRIKYCTVLIV